MSDASQTLVLSIAIICFPETHTLIVELLNDAKMISYFDIEKSNNI
jgi:hypothetical protein